MKQRVYLIGRQEFARRTIAVAKGVQGVLAEEAESFAESAEAFFRAHPEVDREQVEFIPHP